MNEILQIMFYLQQTRKPYTQITLPSGYIINVYLDKKLKEIVNPGSDFTNLQLLYFGYYLQDNPVMQEIIQIWGTDEFSELPERIQNALIEHEIGHAICQHNLKMPSNYNRKDYVHFELEADTYVTDKEALEDFLLKSIEATEKGLMNGDIEEYYLRIQALHGEI